MDPATKTATWKGYESLDSLVILYVSLPFTSCAINVPFTPPPQWGLVQLNIPSSHSAKPAKADIQRTARYPISWSYLRWRRKGQLGEHESITHTSIATKLPQVGHLINRYSKSSPLVYNYAVGGCTAEHLADQVRQFIEGPGHSTSSRKSLNSLFSEYAFSQTICNNMFESRLTSGHSHLDWFQ